MLIRRVVTGHTPDGKSTVVSDTKIKGATFETFPGFDLHTLWGADETMTFPDDGAQPSFQSYFPPVNGIRFGMVTFSPMSDITSEDSDYGAVLKEMEEKAPGMERYQEPDGSGMHTTNTIDFIYIKSGEVWLELDNGEEIHLKEGDTVVQNGTRHAWRNKTSKPCSFICCIIGANRK